PLRHLRCFPTRRSSDLERCRVGPQAAMRELHALRACGRPRCVVDRGRCPLVAFPRLWFGVATPDLVVVLAEDEGVLGLDGVEQRSEEHTSELQSRFDLV